MGVNLYHLVKAQLFAQSKMPLCGLVFTKPLQIKLFSDLHEEAFLACHAVPARRGSLYYEEGGSMEVEGGDQRRPLDVRVLPLDEDEDEEEEEGKEEGDEERKRKREMKRGRGR